MSTPPTDGRRAKGELRKRELIEATLDVVARSGIAGVSHRAVARVAGLEPTAAAYHFSTIDDLLTAALVSCMEEDAARMRALAREPVSDEEALCRVARNLVAARTEPGRLLAEYELFLQAARRPELRRATGDWLEAVDEFGRRYTSDPARLRMLRGTVDGVLLHALLTDDPPTVEEYEDLLRRVLDRPVPD